MSERERTSTRRTAFLGGGKMGEALLSGQGGLSVAGRVKADDWNGRRGVQFEIEDVHDPRRV